MELKTKEDLKEAIKLARADLITFCELCFRDEHGRPWVMGSHHREWAELLVKKTASDKPDELFNVRRLVIFSPTDTGKSEFISIAYPIWLLGRNPNLRIIIVSNTYEQVEKFVLAIQQHILENEFVRLVFPWLRPKKSAQVEGRAQKWTSRHILVERELVEKDYSVSGYGVGGAILNARADVIIFDDVLDFENTRSQAQREYVIRWTESTVLPRLLSHGQFVVLGTAWHPNDLMHYLARKPGYVCVKYSLLEQDAADGYRIIKWERYPPERIRRDMEELSPAEFMRQKRCKPAQSDIVTFPAVRNCFVPVERWEPPVKNLVISIGVDLSSSKRKGTAIVVVGMDAQTKQRYVLDVRYLQATGPGVVAAIVETFERYEELGSTPVAVYVENNALQSMVLEWLADSERPDIPVVPFTTGRNKADPELGLPGLAAEFERGLWTIPAFTSHPVTCPCDWCRFNRELTEHPNYETSDGVMALWFAREAFRDRRTVAKAKRRFVRAPRIYFISDAELESAS